MFSLSRRTALKVKNWLQLFIFWAGTGFSHSKDRPADWPTPLGHMAGLAGNPTRVVQSSCRHTTGGVLHYTPAWAFPPLLPSSALPPRYRGSPPFLRQFTPTSTKNATPTPARISSSIVPPPSPSGANFLRHEVRRMARYRTPVRFSLTLPVERYQLGTD